MRERDDQDPIPVSAYASARTARIGTPSSREKLTDSSRSAQQFAPHVEGKFNDHGTSGVSGSPRVAADTASSLVVGPGAV